MTPDPRVVPALLRRDLTAFTQRCFQTVEPGKRYLHNWHLEAIAHQLERCLKGEVRRLLVTIPPRSLKSMFASVAFPAFALGHDPSLRIVCASYAQDLSGRLARDCRTVMEAEWYRKIFPQTRLDPRKNTEAEFETTARGYRLATSVGGTLTGRGGNLILIDDSLKPAEALSEVRRSAVNEWFDTTLTSRLDSKTEGTIVVIMQRLHVDDLVGHLLEKAEAWTHLNLPAIAEAREEIPLGRGQVYVRQPGELLHPEREPREVLDELKATMGSQAFSAQYQQAPIPIEGALIKAVWLRSYARAPEREGRDQIVQSWDTALKTAESNDFSVCTTWLMKGMDYYLLHVLRERLEYTDLRRRILSHAEAYCPKAVLIEDASSGASLIQDLRREGRLRPIAIKPEGDKVMRLAAQSPVFEAGRVFLPEAAPWLDDFRAELLAFHFGRHDDQVDSTSQFLAWGEEQQQRYRCLPGSPVSILKESNRIRF